MLSLLHPYQEAATRMGREPSLFRVYRKAYGRRVFGAAILKLVGDLAFFINPLALGGLTAFATSLKYPDEDAQVRQGLGVPSQSGCKKAISLLQVKFE